MKTFTIDQFLALALDEVEVETGIRLAPFGRAHVQPSGKVTVAGDAFTLELSRGALRGGAALLKKVLQRSAVASALDSGAYARIAARMANIRLDRPAPIEVPRRDLLAREQVRIQNRIAKCQERLREIRRELEENDDAPHGADKCLG